MAREDRSADVPEIEAPTSGPRRVKRLPPPRRIGIPWRAVLALSSCVSLAALVYYYSYARDFSRQQQTILHGRAALASEIADDYSTLRTHVEAPAISAASKPYPGDFVDPEAKLGTWRERPSVYLRTRVADATSIEALHTAGKQTAADGLISCLLRVKGDKGPWTWSEVAARADMLGSAFTTEVRETHNDLRLRNLEYAFEVYRDRDFPMLKEAVHLAEFAIIALDEDPAKVPATSAAFGSDATIEQKILAIPHPIRVYVIRLVDGKELLRVRRTPNAEIMQVAGDSRAAAGVVELRAGQAMGCGMADDVLAAAGIVAPDVAPSASAPLK